MALEDVDYLYENSVKKSYMFYIDSKDRDRNVYPHPNNYAITFSAPFKNVYSLEILDASIPRTQYAIDSHNNTLVYKYGTSGTIRTIKIPVGDYSDKNLITVINNALESATDGNDITIQNVSISADERSTFVFYATQEFILDMNKSTLRTVLGFDLLADDSYRIDELGNSKYDLMSTEFPTDFDNYDSSHPYVSQHTEISGRESPDGITDEEKRIFETKKLSDLTSVLNNMKSYFNRLYKSKSSESDYRILNVFEGSNSTSSVFPLNAEPNDYTFGDQTFNTSYNAIGQTFTISQDSSFDSFEIFFNDSREITCGFVIYDNDSEITGIGSQFTKLPAENSVKVYLSDDVNRSGDYTLIIFNPRDEEDTPGGDENYRPVNSDKLTNVNICVNLSTGGDTFKVLNYDGTYNSFISGKSLIGYSLCVNINTKQSLHKIEAPGMYSLIGDRYAILRCPEIEQHLFASHSFEKYSMGLAKFKLTALGYNENRFDFTSLPSREFHPIGKLTQMTFTFERPDGGLYNFRGINHTITMAIRYLVPQQRGNFNKFILNPQYDPDFFRYQQNQESESDNSDDEY